MVEFHEKEKIPPTVRTIGEVFEEEEPRSAGDDHMVPVRVHREDMEPEAEQVNGGLDIILPAERLKCDYAVHGGRRDLPEREPAMIDDLLSKWRKRQCHAGLGIGNIDGDITSERMRSDAIPNHLELRLNLVGIQGFHRFITHCHGGLGARILAVRFRRKHIE